MLNGSDVRGGQRGLFHVGPGVGPESHQVNVVVVQMQHRQMTRLILNDMYCHTD